MNCLTLTLHLARVRPNALKRPALLSQSKGPSTKKMQRSGADRRSSRELFNLKDITTLVNLPIWSLCALVLPQRLWPKAARLLARFSAQRLRPIEGLDERVASQFPAIADRLDANRIEHSFQYLRDWLPGGWDVKCDIEGLEHLAAAKKAGRGVVLWMGHFVFHGLASKKLLYHAGFPFHHLSRPEHGYSKTRLGICLLNPVRSKIEDRYLASRILIATGSEWRALRRAGSHLRSGGLVSVTAGAWEGRSTLEIPFLGGLGLLP